jgi:hypothetical protein
MDRTVNGGHGLGGGRLRHASYTSSDLIVGLTMQTSKEGNTKSRSEPGRRSRQVLAGLRVGGDGRACPTASPAATHRLLRIRQVNHLPALSSHEIPGGLRFLLVDEPSTGDHYCQPSIHRHAGKRRPPRLLKRGLAAVIARVPKARMSPSVRCRVIWSPGTGAPGTSQGSPGYLGLPECLR